VLKLFRRSRCGQGKALAIAGNLCQEPPSPGGNLRGESPNAVIKIASLTGVRRPARFVLCGVPRSGRFILALTASFQAGGRSWLGRAGLTGWLSISGLLVGRGNLRGARLHGRPSVRALAGSGDPRQAQPAPSAVSKQDPRSVARNPLPRPFLFMIAEVQGYGPGRLPASTSTRLA
jgi:hypothetical protein